MAAPTDRTMMRDRIGHPFADPALLAQALTHRSAGSPHNERLEFLGDGVVNLIAAEALYARWPNADEGALTRARAELVRESSLADVARRFDLGARLTLGPGEMKSGGHRRDSILSDALEAVIAAVYLDAGFEAARAVVLALWGGRVGSVEADARDAKTALQEWAQGRGLPPPAYTEMGREGPDHQPLFTVEVRLSSGEAEVAQAGAKRQAEQAAARALLARMEAGNG